MAVTVDNTKGAYTIPALSGSGYVPIGGGTMTGALTIASGTLAASSPALTITQTWNGAGQRFDTFVMDITNTSSGLSYPVLIRVNGAEQLYLTKSGDLYAQTLRVLTNAGLFAIGADVFLYRDAAATLALRNGTNAQTLRVYSTYTDSSNYERLKLTGVAGTSVNITAETLGTGGDNLDIVLTPAGTGRLTTPAIFETSAIVAGILTGGATTINYYTGGVRTSSTGEFAWTVGNANASVDAALMRNAAGIVEVNNGTAASYRDVKLRNLLNTEYHQMTEMAAPHAPATKSVRIYAEDNGSGKTRLMALFATGAAQQIAIEP